MSAPPQPFAQLGIAPTTDRARIKRAYFEAIARHPPHRDANAFARVRAAYEALLRRGGAEAAALLLPLDAELDGAPYRERYAARIEAARQRRAEQAAAEAVVSAFVERASCATLQELLGQRQPSNGKVTCRAEAKMRRTSD